jgi:putative methionine-R-sulfoxide reductase with GAF domain
MAAPDDDRRTHPPDDLADIFAEVARELLAEEDLPAVLSRISRLAVETIGGADHCGVTTVVRRRVETTGASDDVPRQIDQIQYDTGEGPCLDAIREDEVFETGDIRAERHRWQAFAVRAAEESGVRSILSFRLFGGETMGALNLYSEEVDAFDDEDRHVGSVFAAHAAVAMEGARRVENMERALASRDVIATAKGMLMARSELGEEEAFDVLRRASQRMNVKLREVARRVVAREPLEQAPQDA